MKVSGQDLLVGHFGDCYKEERSLYCNIYYLKQETYMWPDCGTEQHAILIVFVVVPVIDGVFPSTSTTSPFFFVSMMTLIYYSKNNGPSNNPCIEAMVHPCITILVNKVLFVFCLVSVVCGLTIIQINRQEQYYLFSGNLEIFDYGGVGPPSSRPNPPVMIRILVPIFFFLFSFFSFVMLISCTIS